MSRAFKSLCLVLALLWVPLTQHCLLEAAVGGASSCEHATEASCAHDSCEVVEGGSYKVNAGTAKAVPPVLIACVGWLASVTVPEPETRDAWIADDRRDRPPDWVPNWQFVQRAAPPARAPSPLG